MVDNVVLWEIIAQKGISASSLMVFINAAQIFLALRTSPMVSLLHPQLERPIPRQGQRRPKALEQLLKMYMYGIIIPSHGCFLCSLV
jgi:hypothetical protein